MYDWKVCNMKQIMRHFSSLLLRDIIRGSPDVNWETIKGLENAKRLLKEAVVMPIKYPK